MALSSSELKDDMITQLESMGFDTSNEFSWAEKFCTAISTAIVNHLQQKGEVITGSGGQDSGTAGAGMINPAKIN